MGSGRRGRCACIAAWLWKVISRRLRPGPWRPVRRATFRDDQPERMVCGRCRTRSTGIVTVADRP